MINWKNTAENLGLILASMTLGVILGSYITHRTSKSTLEAFAEANNKVLIEAIKKETVSTENNFDVDVEKTKGKKGGKVDINIAPKMENEVEASIVKLTK